MRHVPWIWEVEDLKTVSIVAGGWSVKGDNWCLEFPGYVIAVNDSALHLPRLDCVVSMDRLWTENRWDWLCQRKIEAYIRVDALKNLLFTDMPWLHPFHCDYKSNVFTLQDHNLNGTNSGLCAFNHAYKLMPQQILLFGFDMQQGPNGEQHWYADHSWKDGKSTKPTKLSEWAREFDVPAKMCKLAGIQVWNMSSRSLIKQFPIGNSNSIAQ